MESLKNAIIRKFNKVDNYLDQHPGFVAKVNIASAITSGLCVIFLLLLLLLKWLGLL